MCFFSTSACACVVHLQEDMCMRACATPIAYCELTEDEDEEATNGITLAPSQGTGTDIAQLPVNGIVGMKLWCELV